MPIVKVIEVIASSDNSFDEAIKNAVAEVSKTIKNIDSVFGVRNCSVQFIEV